MEELFHFTEGENFLYIKNYYYLEALVTGTNWYYVEYEALSKPKLEIGETEYQTIYNQVYSQLDGYKYYKYLHKYLLSMGKVI